MPAYCKISRQNIPHNDQDCLLQNIILSVKRQLVPGFLF